MDRNHVGYWAMHSSICSHSYLICFHHTARFTHALCCTHFSLARSLSLSPEFMGKPHLWIKCVNIYELTASISYHFNPQLSNGASKGTSKGASEGANNGLHGRANGDIVLEIIQVTEASLISHFHKKNDVERRDSPWYKEKFKLFPISSCGSFYVALFV